MPPTKFNAKRGIRYTSLQKQAKSPQPAVDTARQDKKASVLERLPTKSLIRSLVLTSIMSNTLALRPSLAVLGCLEGSKSSILNPDRNILLNKLLRWTVYNHFCAGVTHREVIQSVREIKDMGYQGVILGYAKEAVLDADEAAINISPTAAGGQQYGPKCYEMIEEWKNSTLQTLRMLGPGDFLAVKLTGAGPISIDAMRARKPIPEALEKALNEICEETVKQNSRLWLDAEQSLLQTGLDEWAIFIMRRFNRGGKALVYNTIQAYLKSSKANVDRHITLAANEGWAVGIKLVRGAYIEHEVRSLIHDTKEDTDRCYDLIVDMLISQPGENFPPTALFLASHNAASTEKALFAHRQRVANNQPATLLDCGQVQGMADELSCKLVLNYEASQENYQSSKAAVVPRAFKYLVWGSVAECMGYLHRRAIESRGAVQRTSDTVNALKQEIKRRVFG